MGDYEQILAAYLFLIALNEMGVELQSFNIHLAWVEYCRGIQMPGDEILAAAISQGFQRYS